MTTKRETKAARENTEPIRTNMDQDVNDPNLCEKCGAFLDENHAHSDGNDSPEADVED